MPLPEAEVARALGSLELEALEQGALVAREGGEVRALVFVDEHDGVLLAYDRETSEEIHASVVRGIERVSILLAALTVRLPVKWALDLGTGSGIHALLAARHAHRVVATDVSPRALAFAEFNAALNGATNVDFVQADWLEGAPTTASGS